VEGFLLQDWTTIRSDSTTTLVTQSEPDWLDLLEYRDIVLWLEVAQRNVGGGTDLLMRYETAPSKDEVLFALLVPAFRISVSTTPHIEKILESQNPSVPLCRWLRWSIQGVAPTGMWGATFRIHCAVNRGGPR
jgi:hypothetical protein